MPGVNGPIVFDLFAVPGTPCGSTSMQTFSLTPSQLVELQAGRMYLNVNSDGFPSGEIRGQLALVPAPSCATSTSIILDGGFEATSDSGVSPNWSSTSTAFGTSLCTVLGCGGGPGVGPRQGNAWTWFDGTGSGAASENGTAAQSVVLPLGAKIGLSYYQRFQKVSAPSSSVLTVTVDGNVAQTIAEPATADADYVQRTVDLSAYANGTARTISFNYGRPAGTTDSDNAMVDDVSLSVMSCPVPILAVLMGVASRKVHAGTNFDLPLSLVPTSPTIEPRSGPFALVFSYDRPMALSGELWVSEGFAQALAGTVSGNDIVFTYSTIPDQQYVTVTHFGSLGNDGSWSGSHPVRFGLLMGDVNQSRVVTLTDLGLVNSQLAQPATVANYLMDVNLSGTVTLSDRGLVNGALTHSLRAP